MPPSNWREKIAELEHKQWIEWSQNISITEEPFPKRFERWTKLWKPYSELTEEEKNQDRKWADKVLIIFNSILQELEEEIEALKKNPPDYNGREQALVLIRQKLNNLK